MNPAEDDDLKLQRASVSLLYDLERLLPRIVRKHDSNEFHRRVREIDMQRVFALIEPFQEDPQLLDSHLKSFIPPLVAAYLDTLQTAAKTKQKKSTIPLSHAICQILNLFCKVRGEKVIKGFLNNEPRYLEPILNEFEIGRNYVKVDDEPLPQYIVPWTERYILLLWLSHLMLAPFPLASMSALQSSEKTSTALGVALPREMPEITLRALVICFSGLQTASKERGAAANLLVKLCVRPDMQKQGLLDAVVKWALPLFHKTQENAHDIHQYLGVLSFLAGLVTSAANEEIGPFLPSIYQSCQNIINQPTLAIVKSSAVARRLVIKILRNIVVHCLQATEESTALDTTTALEEVIEFLLEALGDGDTPVRYAASKALSIVTMKLDPEMASEVVNAVLGSLSENVYWQGSSRNLSGVDPLRWHGLTLTLSHLLYRRALSIEQLPEILNALLLALAFEQRSTTGGSIGTNVRDAACFGIWALSRRYVTKELLSVETSSVRASEHQKSLSIPQVLAIELLVVACLDPAGNIRRGSSAALQELIGRHPNTVEEGIPLVQIVDFHAVGLRERAMCEISSKASQLHSIYWEALFKNLLGWRGTGSLDSTSRLFAARAVGMLSANRASRAVRAMSDQICGQLATLKSRQVEERQGLVSALAALIDEGSHLEQSRTSELDILAGPDRIDLSQIWGLLERELKLEEKAFYSPALRPDFTASSICNLLGALAIITVQGGDDPDFTMVPINELTRSFNLCLGRHAEPVLEAIPRATRAILRLLSTAALSVAKRLVDDWLEKLENEASYDGLRWSGFAIALGAAYSVVGEYATDTHFKAAQTRIVEVLTFRCTSAVAIEPRKVAMQAIDVLLKSCVASSSPTPLTSELKDKIANALVTGLNDYTVTERGDIGSLVRLEALSTTRTAWKTGLLQGWINEEQLQADVLRLALEKLDKVRLRAAEVLAESPNQQFDALTTGVADGISSYAYFANTLSILQSAKSDRIKEAICVGLVASAGMGSESVVQNSRAVLLDAIDAWPIQEEQGAEPQYSLLGLADCLLQILKQNLETERVLLPLLEILAFLFDMQVLQRLPTDMFNFRALLSYTQKAHFKSTHMQKLHLALDVYRGLGTVSTTRADTITKVVSMLLHPFPKIRISAAETLWALTSEESLKRQDWSLSSKNLKPVVDGIRAQLIASS